MKRKQPLLLNVDLGLSRTSLGASLSDYTTPGTQEVSPAATAGSWPSLAITTVSAARSSSTSTRSSEDSRDSMRPTSPLSGISSSVSDSGPSRFSTESRFTSGRGSMDSVSFLRHSLPCLFLIEVLSRAKQAFLAPVPRTRTLSSSTNRSIGGRSITSASSSCNTDSDSYSSLSPHILVLPSPGF